MELHNIIEDLVIAQVAELFRDLDEERNPHKLCTCHQCRMDTICYTLNRVPSHYIISNRGASRVQWESFERQQREADITTLIYDGLKRVNHNMRPNFPHAGKSGPAEAGTDFPAYNIPAIIGRVFDGENFAPLPSGTVELLWNGELVPMKDGNWQNPYELIPNTEGNYSFWPAPDTASGPDKHRIFDYTIRISAPEFETLIHFFKIPVASEVQTAGSFTLERTFKLPDLYLFPPGEAEKNGYQG